jgi:DNA-binding MarR family transcriptional regulator
MIIGDRPTDVNLMDFYRVLTRCIDRDSHALTIRQLVMLLTCYLFDEDHTVRRLAVRLRVAKPAVSRMLDHLVEQGLIERRTDPRDRRSVLFERTYAGEVFLASIAKRSRGPVAGARPRGPSPTARR